MNDTFHSRHRTSFWLLIALAATVLLIALPILLNTAFAIAGALLFLAAS